MDGFKVDGVLWVDRRNVASPTGPWHLQPLCPLHHLPLILIYNGGTSKFECTEDEESFNLPREINEEVSHIQNKVASKDLRKFKFLNLDDEAIPIAEDKAKSEDEKFFVVARIMKSKVGQRLVVYAGERGKAEKTQIFVEPEIKRLAFDQKDLHPADVFAKVEAEFDNGTKASIEKK